MATPEFILDLREKIGTDLLWLPGVTAVVLRPSPEREGGRQVLLVRRADNGAWTPVTGIIDPGEEPAVAGARECLEETAVVAEPEALKRVNALPEMTYENGDRSQYLDLTFRFRYVSGEPHPADGENLEAAWFELDALPEMSEEMAARVAAGAAPGDVCAWAW
ncbi:NUDIX hydrolase [Demequina mangrovi]|uniref:ADP-ribose pyrophosphatase YjhB, NUDIX family n=1 Tax=Demequina mangrovi TaxID=1043493 RepID=A0A1H6V8V8_9MICO|nr:NUDIX domain-containing protein [Demequina mangrovi]SEI98197.1 ADP-ribose pyrophosphatase YjhB, NUDIX family [Demequina mangrovi]